MLEPSDVEVVPIATADLAAVGAFLHVELNPRLSAAQWAAALEPTWAVEAPNHGFWLRHGGRVVGVQAAFYSERLSERGTERFCNLAAWCVLPHYRDHGVRLLRAALAQRGYHFTDLSPSGSVVEVNRRLRFEELDTTTVLVPHLPFSRGPGRVVTDLEAIAARLHAGERQLLEDHRTAAAVLHLMLVDGDRHCYLMLRRERRRRLRVLASFLHVSDPALLRESMGVLGAHLLRRHGVVASLAEVRVVGFRPGRGAGLREPRARMFRPARGCVLAPQAVDGLYSELTCVAW